MAIKKTNIGRAVVTVDADNNPLRRGLKQSRKMLSNMGSGLSSAGGSMMGAGAAIIGTAAGFATPIAMAMRAGMSFQDQMSKVGAVSTATAGELESLTNKAKELGRTTSFSASQVASGMVELGRAGFKPAQIEEAIPAVMNLARATDTELARAAEVAAASMNMFGLSASDVGGIADALTTTANSSATTVDGLGESLEYAGTVAAGLGMSLEETLAILGTLGNFGVQGSSAGTALKRLATLSAAEATKIGEIFDINLVDDQGNATGVLDMLAAVDDATKNMGSAERMQKLNDAFGLLGISGAGILGQAGGNVKELQDRIMAGQASGSAADAAAAMDDNTGGSFRMLQSAVEGVAIAMHDALGPAFRFVVDGFTLISGKISEFIEKHPQVVLQVVAGIAAFASLGVGLLAAGTALVMVGVSLSAAATILSALLSPVGLIAAAVVMMGASFLATSVDAKTALSSIGDAAQGIIDFIKPVTQGILDAFAADDFALAGQIAMEALKVAIKRGLIAIGEMVASFGTTVWKAIKGAFSGDLSGVGDLFSFVDSGIDDLVGADARLASLIAQAAEKRAIKDAANAPKSAFSTTSADSEEDVLAALESAGTDPEKRKQDMVDRLAGDEDVTQAAIDKAEQDAAMVAEASEPPGIAAGIGDFDFRSFQNQISRIAPPDFQKLNGFDDKFSGMGAGSDASLGLLKELATTNARMLEIEENREPLMYGGA